jgi:hypothetical protein
VADVDLGPTVVIRMDATIQIAHSDKEQATGTFKGALLLFLWVGSGALRRVRGRSSQVKGACGVAARVRFAPP